ncbi:MAG: response regulator [Candidatus Erginobacter occultus]|nr:response regulator [Candidatus Erginobacter occultus]
MNKILIVDDEESMRLTLSLLFRKQGYEVSTASSGEEAVAMVDREIFEVVITDLKMKGLSGLDVLHHVKRVHPETEVIILTAHGTIGNAVEAMKLGAFDYLTKPFEPDEGILVVRKALERKRLIGSVEQLKNEVRDKYRFENLIGKSPKFQAVLEIVRAVAPTDSTVLLQGETGTGKELVAKAIHNLSRRERITLSL